MAEQTLAEIPTAEKTVPWWQRILRRAVDRLRSGFGLFRRSPAGRSGNGEKADGNVEAELADSRNPAEEVQIAEREETELNRTSPNAESNRADAEEQALEAAAVESAIPPEPEPRATDEPETSATDAPETTATAKPEASAGPEAAQNPAAEPAEEALKDEGALKNEEALKDEELQAAVEPEETGLSETFSIPVANSEAAEERTEIMAPEAQEAVEPVAQPPHEEAMDADPEEETPDLDSTEAEPPAPEQHEIDEPVADQPREDAIVADSEEEAAELPVEMNAAKEPDITEAAHQAAEFSQEEDRDPAPEDAAVGQAMDAPEEAAMEPAEPDESLKIEPGRENADAEKMEAAPGQEERPAEADAEIEPAPVSEEIEPEPASPELVSDEAISPEVVSEEPAAPELASEDAPLVGESMKAEEERPSEEEPEAIAVAKETNIDGAGTAGLEPAAESAESAEPPSSAPISTDAPAAEDAPAVIDADAAESGEPLAEAEMPVAEPGAPVAEPKALVAEPEADAAQEMPVAEPLTPVAEPLTPVAEPPAPSPAPAAELTAEERKKADKVAAAVKARSQSEEQSPFSVMVGQIYEGPLDLLLDLIRKQDIDIYDIPIAKITAQFLAYVDRLRAGDMDVAGEFIYTAALLIHIKSKMLLPRDPAGPDDAAEDPRHELVERLLEHERFKNAAQMLQQKQLLEAATWTRPGLREFGEEADAEPEIAADTVDLVRVFREVLDRARNRPVMNLEEDAVTVGQMIRFLARRLTMDDRPVALRRLLSQSQSERMLIAIFLALLEMVRLQAVLLRQDRQFSEIFIKKHTGFDSLMNEGLDSTKDDWR